MQQSTESSTKPSIDWIVQTNREGRVCYINCITGNTTYIKPHESLPIMPLYQIQQYQKSALTAGATTETTTLSVRRLTQGLQPPKEFDAALFGDWNNPVFPLAPSEAIGLEEAMGSKLHHRMQFNKGMLASLKVISQIDKKFIACILNQNNLNSGGTNSHYEVSGIDGILIMMDQHAAHERVRLERLLGELYHPVVIPQHFKATADPLVSVPALSDEAAVQKKHIRSQTVNPPLTLQLKTSDIGVMLKNRNALTSVGIIFTVDETNFSCGESLVSVHSVPACFLSPDGKYRAAILVEFITETVQHLSSTGVCSGVGCTVPDIIHQSLCSHACHGAIKFGDVMTTEQCKRLVSELSNCALPFQCAHGRPSIVPLVNLGTLTGLVPKTARSNISKPKLYALRRRMVSKYEHCKSTL